jgi:tetratricopeptide (TPR) repeat protein
MMAQILQKIVKRAGRRPFWSAMLVLGTLAGLMAASAFGQKSASSSSREESLLAQAKQAEEKHDYPAAVNLYRDFLKVHPAEAEVLQRLGLVYYLSNHFNQAISSLRQAVALNPSLWGSYLFLGISDYRTGRFQQAEESLRRALALNASLPEANFWYGATLLATGRAEEAIPYLQQSSQNPRTALEAQSTLTYAYQKAAEDYEQEILKRFPASARAHQLMAESLEAQGHHNAALLEYRRALAIQPRLKGVHLAMGEIYWQEHRYDAAEKEFESEMMLNPASSEANLRLGEYWVAKGKPAEAVRYLRSALAHQTTNSAEAWHFLGIADLNRRDWQGAEAALLIAVKTDPLEPSNHRLLAEVYHRLGKLQQERQERDLLQKLSAKKPPGR